MQRDDIAIWNHRISVLYACAGSFAIHLRRCCSSFHSMLLLDAFNRPGYSAPLHEHRGWAGIYGWPRLLVEVYYEDEHNRMDLGEQMACAAVSSKCGGSAHKA